MLASFILLVTHTSNLHGHLPFSAGWLLPKSEINLLQKGMNGIKEAIILIIKGYFRAMVLSKQTLLSLALVSAHVKIRFISVVFSLSIFHIVKVIDVRIRCMLSIPALPAIENSRTRAKAEGHFRDASSLCFQARL